MTRQPAARASLRDSIRIRTYGEHWETVSSREWEKVFSATGTTPALVGLDAMARQSVP
jgi:hypothetical protein